MGIPEDFRTTERRKPLHICQRLKTETDLGNRELSLVNGLMDFSRQAGLDDSQTDHAFIYAKDAFRRGVQAVIDGVSDKYEYPAFSNSDRFWVSHDLTEPSTQPNLAFRLSEFNQFGVRAAELSPGTSYSPDVALNRLDQYSRWLKPDS